MAKQSALDTLIELAQRDTDEAAKRLGVALKAVDEAEQKLTMLLGFRDDYGIKLEAAQKHYKNLGLPDDYIQQFIR